MAEIITAKALLRDAERLLDDRPELLEAAAQSRGPEDCARWMARALGRSPKARGAGRWLLIKYVLAGLGAAPALIASATLDMPALALLFVPLFYAIEAQMVFLLPVTLEGAPRPLLAARAQTRAAGGTWAVMRVVMPIAASMLAGGLLGRGFLRAWVVGCLAVCLWYTRLGTAR